MQKKLVGLGLLATVAMVGCGGGGGGGNASNPFSGGWEAQNATLDVRSDGRFDLVAEFNDATETYQGKISSSGNITGTLRSTEIPGRSFPITGTVSRNSTTSITVHVTATNPETGATASTSAMFVKVRSAVNRSTETSPLAQVAKKLRNP